MTGNRRKILVADDHVIIRRGIRGILYNHFNRDELVEASSLAEIRKCIADHSITHLILDLQLHDGNLIELLPEIRATLPQVPIMIFSMANEEVYGKKMMEFEVAVFLSKNATEEEIVRALDLFFQGKTYYCDHLKWSVQHKDTNPLEQLSTRELCVLSRLLKGEPVKLIAESLALKPTTVATYKARIFDKMEVDNVFDLKAKAELYYFKSN